MTTLPTINLNGTSAKMLMRENLEAQRAIEDALEAIRKVEFHPRDYPNPGQWEAALAERTAIERSLFLAGAHFMAVAEHAANLCN